MIVEFIESTSAGKTSLISKIRHKLAQTKVMTTPFDLIAVPLGLRRVTHPTAQNLIQELVGFPSDLVILLTVPVEVAILRNKNRGKEEPEDFVRLRHAQSSNLEFEKAHVYVICTTQGLGKTILDARKAIWKAL